MSDRQLLDAFEYPENKKKALSILASLSNPSIVKRVRDSDYNESLLHMAARNGWLDIVIKLITQHNCDPYCEDSLGRTALHSACINDRTDVVKYLTTNFCLDLSKKKDMLGDTPSSYCTGTESGKHLRMLIDAKEQGFGNVVEYLKHCRDKEFEAAIVEAMEEGGGELLQSNIVLHGPPGAGKSSVKRLILGQAPLPKQKQNATDILEKSVRTVCIDRVAAAAAAASRHFEIVDNDQIISRIAGEVEKRRGKKVNDPSSEPMPKGSSSTTDDNVPLSVPGHDENPRIVPVTSINPTTVEDSSKPTSSATTVIKSKLLHATPSHKMFNSRWHHYVDSGGLPQFLDVLLLLYRSPSHFIVVLRLTEGLDGKPKVRFYSQGNDVYELPDRLVLTNREMIVQTCQIAQSIAQATSGKFVPRVFVIGTHKDKLFPLFRRGSLKKMNAELLQIHEKYSEVLVCKSEDEVMFAMNTMAEGREREQYTEEIQQRIQSATEKSSDPVNVPLKFHLELDKGDGVVRMSECYEVGARLGMDERQVHLALEFLNQAALILYYPADVHDLVLTKMDPFTSKLSRLIKASFIPPDDGPTKESTELRQKGVFKKSFLKRVFDGLEESLISDDEFLKLLESLKVAVHIGGEEYFLPSAMSLDPPPKGPSFKSGSVPLALLWDELILPHGFFLTVAVELVQKSGSEDGYVFELRTDIAQWRGEIQVSESSNKIPGVVKLTDRKTWIQVSYSSDSHYCSKVYHAVERATHRAVTRFQHTGIGSPTTRYLCPLCKTKDHYCYLSDDKRFITCSLNNSKTGPSTPDMLCWTEGTRPRYVPELRDVQK